MRAQSIDHYSGEELEALAGARHYQNWIADQFRPYLRGRIMEIGAGIGTMTKNWLQYADELHVLEPADNLFPVLRGNFRAFPNVQPHYGDLDRTLSMHPDLAVEAFDALVMVNVLEHIEDDLGVLSTMHRMLRFGGHLLIFVPAMPALYGSLDQKFDHYRRYDRSGLVSLCQKAGYEIVRSRYFDFFGVLPWWLVGRVFHSTGLSPRMTLLYDRLVVPVARHVEKLIAPPVGKNLVLIGQKSD